MPIFAASGATFEPLAVDINEARAAIYVALHRDTERVYVGMTRGLVSFRWRQHCRDTLRSSRRYHFAAALRKYGADAFDVHVIEHGIVDSELPSREAFHVRRLSADMRHFGFNSTAGGDAAPSAHPETRKKIGDAHRGRTLSLDHRMKVSAAMLGRKWTQQQREKFIKSRTGIHVGDEWRAALSASHMGKRHTDETRQKMSDAHAARCKTAEERLSRSERMRRRWADPVERAKIGARLKEAAARPEVKAKLCGPKVISARTRELLRQAANKRWAKQKGGELCPR
jgi:group I intron endonuclease